MAKFRTLKQELEKALLPPAWPEEARDIPSGALSIQSMEAVSPLLALLPRAGLLKWRAVLLLGRVVPRIAEQSMDDARTVMRRCMWHLNEDSGNMGWGIAEAMGEIAANSTPLAGEYGRVILSYARDTGFADNFIDHARLRRGVYWAIGRFAPLYPRYREEGGELLLTGLSDQDAVSRGLSAWGLGKLLAAWGKEERSTSEDKDGRDLATASLADALLAKSARDGSAWMRGLDLNELRERLVRIQDRDLCEVLDGARIRTETARTLAAEVLRGIA